MRKWTVPVNPSLKQVLLTVLFAAGTLCLSPAALNASDESTPSKSEAVNAMVLEDGKGLLASIQRRQKELDDREEDLKAREERLQAVKKDIDAKIKELEKVRSEIEAFAGKIDDADNDRVKRLVKIYESMTPEEAAPRFEKLDTRLAVLILSSMKPKNAAKILEFVKVERSVKLSQLLKLKRD